MWSTSAGALPGLEKAVYLRSKLDPSGLGTDVVWEVCRDYGNDCDTVVGRGGVVLLDLESYVLCK